MLGDDRFERSLLAERGGILGAQAVQVALGFGFLAALGLERLPQSGDLFSQSAHPLRDGFKFQRKLAALPAESFHLRVGRRRFQPADAALRDRPPPGALLPG